MDIALDFIVSIVGLATVAQYIWSLRAHFDSPSMQAGARITSLLVVGITVLILILTFLVDQPLWVQVVGLAVQVLSLVLFWSAIRASRNARLRFAFDPEGPRSLVTEGPYAYVRHPFYVSYILFWLGWAFATWTVWPFIPVAVLIGVYVYAARMEERLFAGTDMSSAYAEYRQRTGFLWPKL